DSRLTRYRPRAGRPLPPLATPIPTGAIPPCGRPARAVSEVVNPVLRRKLQAIRMPALAKLRTPLSEFVQTAPAFPAPAPRPFHAAARACTGDKHAARWHGRC